MSCVEIDASDFKKFFETVEKAAKGDFRKELETFLDGIGNDFLRVVQDEIIRRKVMDTRLLLNSFQKGGNWNVWKINAGGLTLEVGSSVHYAGYVNDGHSQQPGRFIPGHWSGDRFIYDPSAKTGMVLKKKWVKGKHYWESALRIYDKLFPELLDKKLQEWLNKYFGG